MVRVSVALYPDPPAARVMVGAPEPSVTTSKVAPDPVPPDAATPLNVVLAVLLPSAAPLSVKVAITPLSGAVREAAEVSASEDVTVATLLPESYERISAV